jgi:hypothetical protein
MNHPANDSYNYIGTAAKPFTNLSCQIAGAAA